MFSTFANCALNFEQVDCILFFRDEENKLETAKLYFRNGREIHLDTSSANALAETFEVSLVREETSTTATTSDT